MPFQRRGSLTLRDSTISANFTGDGGDSEGPGGFAGAGGEGGGLETLVPLTAVNSTIVGNHTGITGTAANAPSNSQGGGVLTAGVSAFTNVTIAGNQTGVAGAGGGVRHVNGSVALTNTIVADNAAPNCGGIVGDGGGNLAYPPTDLSCPVGFNRGNPLLGALGDHGGPTPTLVPAVGSAAVDTAQGAGCPDADQRGIGRPIGTGCDIGAVERVVSVATTGVATGIGETFATLAGSVDNPGPASSARFQYGPTTAYGSESASFPIPANTPGVAVAAVVAPLTPGTTYHFRLIATGTDGASVSADASFTTAASPVSQPPPTPPSPSPSLRCDGRVATIVATPGRRTRGTARADVIVGTSGADRIDGGGGNDRICAGRGNDRVDGGPGADRVDGGSGDDRVSGGSGTDLVIGGPGADTVSGGGGARDRISGGSGNDRVRVRDNVRDSVNCGSGDDQAAADDVDQLRRCELPRRG
jgi:hypothetical protein